MVKCMFGFVLYLVVALVMTLSFVGFVRAGTAEMIMLTIPPPVTIRQYGQSQQDYQYQQQQAEQYQQNRWNQYQQQQQIDLQEEQLETQQQMLRIEQQRDQDATNYRYRAR